MKKVTALCSMLLPLCVIGCANADSAASSQEEAIVEQETLAIIKPEVVKKNLVGEVLARIEKAGLKVKCLKKVHLTKEQAGEFYVEHKNKKFYGSLCKYMSSGPIVVAVLGGKNAVEDYRKLEGATDPTKAAEGTLRKIYGTNIESNGVHGSDSVASAKRETRFFFSDAEITSAAR